MTKQQASWVPTPEATQQSAALPAPRLGRRPRTPLVIAALAVAVVPLGAFLVPGDGDAQAQPALSGATGGNSSADAVAVADEASTDALAAIDWKPAAYEAADCVSRDEWMTDGWGPEGWDSYPFGTTIVDVTGDDVPDVLAVGSCPAPTSTRPVSVVLFDGADEAHPVLAVVHPELFFPAPELTIDGEVLTVSGPTIAGNDAYCCPEHWGSIDYTWMGDRFAAGRDVELFTSQPFSTAALDDGAHVGIIEAVVPGRVYLDLVDWYEGAEARAACVPDAAGYFPHYFCDEFFMTNDDDRVHVLETSERPAIALVDFLTNEPVQTTDIMALLGTESLANGNFSIPFRVTVRDGKAVSLEEIDVS
jgi:hypothetical protein